MKRPVAKAAGFFVLMSYLYQVNEPIISVRQLTKQYQAARASGVSNITFDINPGEIVAILGESGSGKSTLLKCIYGLLKVDAGQVLFNGKRVFGPDELLIPGHKDMKMVTQDFSLNIYAKVYDNIAAMLNNKDVKAKQQKTDEMMAHLNIAQLRDKKIIELSGGEQQRVAIAKALISDTSVLLLDEPFSQVDAVLKNQLRADIKRIVAETGVTVIMVSHDPADALFLADQLLLIKDGQLLQKGNPAFIYNHPEHPYTAQLLGNANILTAADAARLGLPAKGKTVAFYSEWVTLGTSFSSSRYEVVDVYYKGFYEELLLERNGVRIRAIHLNRGEHKKKDHVQASIGKQLTFG